MAKETTALGNVVVQAFEWTREVLVASAPGLARNLLLLVLIIIPLMIGIELMREWRLLDRFSQKAEPMARWLGMSGKAAFPLVSGIVFGLAYGAGVILESVRQDGLSQRDCRLLCIFLVACHAVIEDTLLFVPFGVNPVALLSSRLALAVVMTVAAARWMDYTERKAQQRTNRVGLG